MGLKIFSLVFSLFFNAKLFSQVKYEASLNIKKDRKFEKYLEAAQERLTENIKIDKKDDLISSVEKYPQFDKVIKEILQRLNAAQAKVVEKNPFNPKISSVETNYYILNEENINASIVLNGDHFYKEVREILKQKKRPYLKIYNNLLINVGLIEEFIKKEDDIYKLVAIIAHEYAHTLDYVMLENSFSASSGKKSNKAQEYAADYFAKEILSEANFSPSLLSESLQELERLKLERKGSNVESLIRSGISTHPERILRATFDRVTATNMRYEEGWNEFIELNNKVSLDEIRSNRSFKSVFSEIDINKEFSDLDEILNEMIHLVDSYNNNYKERAITKNVQILNVYQIKLDSLLKENPQVVLSQKEKITKIFSFWILETLNSNQLLLEKAFELNEKVYSPFVNRNEALSRFSWTKSDEFKSMLMEYLKERKINNSRRSWAEGLKPFMIKGFVGDIYIENFQNKEIASWDLGSSYQEDPLFRIRERVFSHLKMKDKVLLLTEILGNDYNYFKKSNLDEVMRFLFNASKEQLFPLVTSNYKGSFPSFDEETVKSFEKVSKLIWGRKEEFALAEMFLTNDRVLNWPLVFKSIGISKDKGLSQLKEGMKKKLTNSKNMSKWSYQLKRLTDNPGDQAMEVMGINLIDGARLGKKVNPIWFSDEILSYLEMKNMSLVLESDKKILKRILKTRFYLRDPDSFRRDYKIEFSKLMNQNLKNNIDFDKLESIRKEVFYRLIGKVDKNKDGLSEIEFKAQEQLTEWVSKTFDNTIPYVKDLELQWIDNSSLSFEKKQHLMSRSISSLREKESPRIYNILKKYKASVFEILSESYNVRDIWSYAQRKDFYINSSYQLLDFLRETSVETGVGAEQLKKIVNQFWNEGRLDIMAIKTNRSISLKKALVNAIEISALSIESKIDLLAKISRDGAMKEIDVTVLKIVKNNNDPKNFLAFIQTTKDLTYGEFYRNLGVFYDEKNTLKWLNLWIDAKYGVDKKFSSEDVKEIIYKVKSFDIQNPVIDDLFESLAWRCPKADLKLLNFIEKNKVKASIFTNKSSWASTANMISTYLKDASELEIEMFTLHLRDNPGKGLNHDLKKIIKQRLLKDISQQNPLQENLTRFVFRESGSDQISNLELIERVFDSTDRFLSNMKQSERIPLLDILIHTGKYPISKQINWIDNYIENFLDLSSSDRDTLLAFIDSIPRNEYSVTLSYLCSIKNNGNKGERLSTIFNAFKAPGKRAAQDASILKLFGDNSEELSDFKENAKPMSKYRFREVLEKELSQKQLKQIIEINEMKGSASLKTVALVTLDDGTQSIVTVIDPKALRQSLTHLKFGKKFLKNLEQRGLSIETELLSSLVDSLERQVVLEVDAKYEAKYLKKMKVAADRINSKYKESLNGWEYNVPKLNERFTPTSHVLVMEIAPGVSFESIKGSLSKDLEQEIGRLLLEGVMNIFFEEGIWDANRHRGNNFIDLENKKITFIDLGQGESYKKSLPFLPDERTRIAELIYGLGKKDEVYVANQLIEMSGKKNVGRDEIIRFSEELKPIFEYKDVQDILIQVYKQSSLSGFPLKDKYSASFLKGLITLYGENYADDSSFLKIIERSVEKQLLSKKPWMIRSELKRYRIENPASAGIIDCAKYLSRKFFNN